MTIAPIVAEDCKTQLKQIRSETFAKHLAVFVSQEGQPPTESQLREPLPLCENKTAALRVAARVGWRSGGMLLTPSDSLSAEEQLALLTCFVEMAFRRGSVIGFRD